MNTARSLILQELGISNEDAKILLGTFSKTAEGDLNVAVRYVRMADTIRRGLGIQVDAVGELVDSLIRFGKLTEEQTINIAAGLGRIQENVQWCHQGSKRG